MELEFIALELAYQEAKWLRGLMANILIYHCGRDLHFLYLSIMIHKLQFCVKSEKNLANPFTKRLPRKIILDTSRGMSLKALSGEKHGGHPISSQT
ncbi:hypothetical protein CR513_57380, partial [Mucuna pruriens]